MANRRVLVKRRKAVRNIRKITRTMQLIATARFQATFNRAVATRPYSQKLGELVGDLARASGDVDHPLMRKNPNAPKTALVVISSNRGLCGGYNSERAAQGGGPRRRPGEAGRRCTWSARRGWVFPLPRPAARRPHHRPGRRGALRRDRADRQPADGAVRARRDRRGLRRLHGLRIGRPAEADPGAAAAAGAAGGARGQRPAGAAGGSGGTAPRRSNTSFRRSRRSCSPSCCRPACGCGSSSVSSRRWSASTSPAWSP